MRMRGKYAVVTGGTRGIGFATAMTMFDQGATIHITGRGERDKSLPRSWKYTAVDFTQMMSLYEFIGELEELSQIDILVNNAGTNANAPISGFLDSDFSRLFNVNIIAPAYIARAVARKMEVQASGRIVNVASVWGVVARPGRAIYGATKGAMIAITRQIAADLAPRGVLVNCVSPGFTDTELTRKMLPPDERAELEGLVPLGRFAKPYEIGRLIAFLSGPNNTYITGQNFIIDGGFTSV